MGRRFMSKAVPQDAEAGSAADIAAEPPIAATQGESVAALLLQANLITRTFDVAAGGNIYEPNTPAKNLFLIQAGQVRILLPTADERERMVRLLEILGTGDWFGAPALAGGATYESRALAVTKVTLAEIPADRLLPALPQHPAIATTFIRSLSFKLQTAYTHAANLVFDDTNQRLIKTLLQFSRTAAATPQGAEEGQPAGVELRITHQQLAQAIGAARETVSLALTQLRQKNLLRTGRNRLSFNPEALESFYNKQGAKPEGQQTSSKVD
jgi:CRP/FNR family transcriptional regulator